MKKTTSNAAFRLAGLEVKIGILLLNEEQLPNQPSLSGAILPSIVIDSVLSVYSILEGLSMLSYFSSVPVQHRERQIAKHNRGKKIVKGIKYELKDHALRKNVGSQVESLEGLRHRCIHQDYADLADGPDYGKVFETEKIKPHLSLLANYLASMRSADNQSPNSNLFEFEEIIL